MALSFVFTLVVVTVLWFVADRSQEFDERCIIQGDVKLILMDGVTITCKITVK